MGLLRMTFLDARKITYMVTIKKAHLVWGLIISFMGPTVAGVSAYYQSLAQLAPKTQVEKLEDKINRIAEDVAEIKGILKERRP